MTEEEFYSRFFPVSHTYRPEKEQVLVSFQTCADFINGDDKRTVIGLIKRGLDKQAERYMQKLIGMSSRTSEELMKQIVEDMKTMSEEEVLEKPYRFIMEKMFWTREEYIPDNEHWIKIKTSRVGEA